MAIRKQEKVILDGWFSEATWMRNQKSVKELRIESLLRMKNRSVLKNQSSETWLEKYWALEHIGIMSQKDKKLTTLLEEEAMNQHRAKTVFSNGHYTTGLIRHPHPCRIEEYGSSIKQENGSKTIIQLN